MISYEKWRSLNRRQRKKYVLFLSEYFLPSEVKKLVKNRVDFHKKYLMD